MGFELEMVQQALGAGDITTRAMKEAIGEWSRLYYRQEATREEDPCQRIGYTVVRKLTQAVFAEYRAESPDPFTRRVLEGLGRKGCQAVQLALIGGESYLKPVVTGQGFRFMTIPRTGVVVLGRDPEGRLTDMASVERTVEGKFYYTLLERRTVDRQGYLTIGNRLFRSYTDGALGQEVALDALERYSDLSPSYTFREPIGSVGLVALRTPMVNCVDGSWDGVSVYAPAVGLIRTIDRNMALLEGEFQLGKSRIVVSADLLRRDELGGRGLVDDTFVGLDEDPQTVGISIFSPALREQSYLSREQALLRSVENLIGLKRGLLSQVEAQERTATEITSTEGEYTLTIMDFQRMWADGVAEAVRLCAILGRFYRLPGAAEGTFSLHWGNGVLHDQQQHRERMLSEVEAGILAPERYLAQVYGLPCQTAPDREKIRREYMPVG